MRRISEKKKKWIERTAKNDRSYKLFLYNRLFLFLLAVALQLCVYALFVLLFAYDATVGVAVQVTAEILALVFVFWVINRNDRPSTKMNWVIIVLIAPVFGVPFYLSYGRGKPTKKMNEKIQRAKSENDEAFFSFYGALPELKTQEREGGTLRYTAVCGGYPAFRDGGVEYFKSGEEAFPVMLDELKRAEKFILLDYFIIAPGKMWESVLNILLEKASRGVQVRIIYDDFGCIVTLPPKYDRYLESLHENIKCLSFNKVVPLFALRMNNRDHRKILVIDGKVAFTGGANLADEYIAEKVRFGYWKDSLVKVTGSSVSSFTRMFFYLWNAFKKEKERLQDFLIEYEDGGQVRSDGGSFIVQPYDDSPLDSVSVGETVYADIIDRAKKYVWIFTPYLVLDDFMRASLCRASLRGVDIRIVTPGVPDKKAVYRMTRANYETLMKAGVKIYEYTPGFLHAKSMVSDDECAVVGTINLDYRSLYLHFENAVYFSGCEAVGALKRDCEETFAVSKLCSKDYPKRTVLGRFVDSVLRVFETLF